MSKVNVSLAYNDSVVESRDFSDPYEAEDYVAQLAQGIFVIDDERFEGGGELQNVSLVVSVVES